MPALRVKSRLEYYQKKKCRKSKVRALLQLIVQDKRGGAWEERGSKKKKKNQHLNDFFLSVLCAKILFSSNYSSVALLEELFNNSNMTRSLKCNALLWEVSSQNGGNYWFNA